MRKEKILFPIPIPEPTRLRLASLVRHLIWNCWTEKTKLDLPLTGHLLVKPEREIFPSIIFIKSQYF